MDSLLPALNPTPPNPIPFLPEPPEPQPICPANSATEAEPTIQTKTNNKTFVKQHTQKPVVQCKHLTIRESIDEFSKKVNSSVATDPLVTDKGQFFWSELAKELIMKDVLKAFSLLNPIRDKVTDLIAAISNDNGKEVARLMKEIPADIEKSGVANAPDLIKMFLPAIAEDPVSLWITFDKLGHVPSNFEKKHKNFNAFIQLRNAEKTACFSVAEFMRRRFEKEGGFTDIDSSKKGKTKPSFTVSPFSGGTRNFEWIGDKTKGDVINYKSGLLSSLITKIKSAIDDGFTVHARVVSGVNFGLGLNERIKAAKGKTPVPNPEPVTGGEEHSLVIIGFDDISDEFIFWDPDSSVSSFNGKTGFGILHFNNNRFTTADNNSDLLVNADGTHSSGQKRYQVLRVFM
ncbi:MAG: hypothetical protein QM763_09530 [Agriterribacter sp.]